MAERLSPLDASFLAAETPTAHMHVGWAARFDAPAGSEIPDFARLREHIGSRLQRAPRYRQRLARVPFGLHDPEWVDDPAFELDNHLFLSDATDLGEAVHHALSTPLDRDRPLWEMSVCRLQDGGLGMVGKAHHCMVDGMAAVDLVALLLDEEPELEGQADELAWAPDDPPGPLELLTRAARDRALGGLDLARLPGRVGAAPGRALADARRAALSLAGLLRPARPHRTLNEPISAARHLGTLARDLDELRTIKRRFGVSVNDVLLAASAGGMRRFLVGRGEEPTALKAMVPVNLREPEADGELGNRISFLFAELPCQEADPVRRLRAIHKAMRRRKATGTARGSDSVLGMIGRAPLTVQRAVTRAVASPRAFNLVVSNVPGPPIPLYLRGCRLREAYPIVPLADRHALSIGFTSIAGRGCFGLYADRESFPDVDLLARDIGAALDELLMLADGGGAHQRTSWRSMTPRPKASGVPSGRVPEKLPNG